MNDDTRELVRQWKVKAQNDWTAVEILLTSDQCPADAVCFHCQQFVEKLLKPLLTYLEIEAPKTHDLRRLIQLAEPFAPELSRLSDLSDKLTVHGVDTRYPGDWYPVTSSEMNEVIGISRQFSNILLPKLEL
jgi:HEPN domain-containing protein